MAGGTGERFWPVSTPALPKQLLDLTGEGKSMLANALDRLEPVVGKDRLWVSTSQTLADPIIEAGLVDGDHVLAEPARRNTLGAIVWTMASLSSQTDGPFAVAFTTSDHAIRPTDAFVETVRSALRIAEEHQALTTIGIPPTRPETGFGYIERNADGTVSRFTEKPDALTAASFLAQGTYFWNSGMFFWTEEAFARELEHAQPAAFTVYRSIADLLRVGDTAGACVAFESLPSISIDYALMEHAERVRCVPATFAWDDVGTWDSLLRTVPLDEDGNAVVGQATLFGGSNNVVYGTTDQRIVASGVEGMIIAVTDDYVYVGRVDDAQSVRNIAKAIQQPEGDAPAR